VTEFPILIQLLGPYTEGKEAGQHRYRGRRVGTIGQETERRSLTLLGYLQLEVVHVHLKGLIARGQLVDIGLNGLHSRKKSSKVLLRGRYFPADFVEVNGYD